VFINANGQLGTARAASSKASAAAPVSARKFSRLQRQVKTLRHEVSRLRAGGH
jgi:hypothetical protein